MKPENFSQFKDKRVLITGATGGLGLALTKFFLQAGAKVIVSARSQSKADKLTALLGKKNIESIILDLSDINSCRKFCDDAAERFKQIDIFINNAGAFDMPPNTTMHGKQAHLVVNFLNTIYITEKLMPLIKNSKTKRIVFVTSLSAEPFIERDFESSGSRIKMYSQSKRFCALAAMKLQSDLEQSGVKISLAHPGICATKIVNRVPIFRVIARGAMHILFQSSKNGAKPIIYAAKFDLPFASVCGPRVLKIWGKPKVYKNYPHLKDKENCDKAFNFYKSNIDDILKDLN